MSAVALEKLKTKLLYTREMTLSANTIDEKCLGDAIALTRHSGESVLDLQSSEWVCPCGSVAMTLLAQHRARAGLATRVLVPAEDGLLNYLGRIDFFRHLPAAVEVDQDLSPLSNHRRQDSDQFTEVILPHVRGVKEACSVVRGFLEEEDPSRWKSLYAPFEEALSNIYNHASYGLEETAFSCTQVQIYSNRIEIAFGDLGVGFHRTLSSGRAPFAPRTEQEALEEAFENRMTRWGRESHHGGGLKNVGRVVESLDGRMRMVTGDGAVRQYRDGERRYGTLSVPFPGVLGWVRLPT